MAQPSLLLSLVVVNALPDKMDVANLPIANHWFETTEMTAPVGCGYSLYRTREVHETSDNDGVHGNYYLLKGPSADLLVDTGIGLASLHQHLEGLGLIGSRPLLVLATHEHFDHTGGLKDFQNATIIMGAQDADSVVYGKTLRTLSVLVKTEYAATPSRYWDAAPHAGFQASLLKYEVQSRVDRRVQYLDTVSLGGGVSFSVIELPGHTPGSIGLWNVGGSKELYAGDAIYDAELLDFLLDSDRSAYRASMEVLDQLDVSVAYPGHEEVLNHTRYRQLINCYMVGVKDHCPGDQQRLVIV